MFVYNSYDIRIIYIMTNLILLFKNKSLYNFNYVSVNTFLPIL